MSTTIASNLQLPDGYTATERIGSGGYGEVWRAVAPGGVEKAIKVVFGHCSEDLAERELKSLERIRSVRHPFVISLERFEIVAGRLIIVTELADMSLDACFRKHQEAGEPGIPRADLISYLSDAADALDCLVERHGLQHLDIKPENLLVVGDHVKVGDFGLVKELATRTLNSMMGGMTPLYSAPEVFDDSPSPRSDQYSLAIVYQQMLTGQLPFPGRTPAQLAKQHTQAEPSLQSLCPGDQQVVRRALAKQPEQRFASCREFVEALVSGEVRSSAPVAASSPAVPKLKKPDPDDDTKSTSAIQTKPVRQMPPAVQAPIAIPAHVATPKSPSRTLYYPTVVEEIVDAPAPPFDMSMAATTPTLVVAAGGLGTTMLMSMRGRLEQLGTDALCRDDLAWLAIDTDRETLNAASSEQSASRLDSADLLHIPLKRPKQYRDGSQSLLRWVSRRWLYNIPRSLETRGYRPLGRIAAVDHAEAILGNLYTRLHQLAMDNLHAPQLRVLLLAGTSGGTGSGIVVDLAQAARSLGADLGRQVQVQAMLAMPERSPGSADSLSIANTYSTLTELTHMQRVGNIGASPPSGPAARYEAESPALDAAYLIPIPPRTLRDQRMRTLDSISEYLVLDNCAPQASAALAACRAAQSGNDFRLRSLVCISAPDGAHPDDLLESCAPNVLRCGYRRITLLVSRNDSQLSASLKSLRPHTAVCEAPVASDALITEAADIDPLHVAARMAEFYPDIAEAADRLRTRDDIEWQDLRATYPPVDQALPARHDAAEPKGVPDQMTIKRHIHT